MQTPHLFANTLTKDSLCFLSEYLGFHMPRSWPKAKMLDRAAQLYARHPEQIVRILSFSDCEWIAGFEGQPPEAISNAFNEMFDSPLSDQARVVILLLGSLSMLGLIDRDISDLSANAGYLSDLIPVIKASHEALVDLDCLEKCAFGLLTGVGIMEETTLCRTLCRLLKIDAENTEFTARILRHRLFLSVVLNSTYDEGTGLIWRSVRTMKEPDFWIDWLESQPTPVYPDFTIEQCLDAAANGYMGHPEGYDRLIEAMVRGGLARDEAEFTLVCAIEELLNDLDGSSPSLFELLQLKPADLDEARALLELCTSVSNTLPRWVLFGSTPAEVAARRRPLIRASKVGRNDPCPCGSGKKYKQCCGRVVN